MKKNIFMIKVGVLTSSRSDYGIYLPLLKAFKNDNFFDLKLIVFGTHLSKFHGFTSNQIKKDGFILAYKVKSLLVGDSPYSVSSSFSLTSQKFSHFWEKNKHEFDLVFALGDRFEMAAAVAASIPYQIPIAHIHGGETTIGAIDNIYRDFITLCSLYHFVANRIFKKRVYALLNVKSKLVYNVGSLSLESLKHFRLLSLNDFMGLWKIDMRIPTILITIHPETVEYKKNSEYCAEVIAALKILLNDFQLVITMPNADTNGNIYRNAFNILAKNNNVKIIENFGSLSYFSCMYYSKLLLGNTSSGIIEAASFRKYVLNLGSRQRGRLSGPNVIHIPFQKKSIIDTTFKYAGKEYLGPNIYYKENPSKKILEIIKSTHAKFSKTYHKK